MKREFLLEIGCEEIPARMVAEAATRLGELLEAELKAVGVLGRSRVQTFFTPRRLVAYCPELLPAEPDQVSETLGPPQAVAFDASGKATQAALSFAARQGVPIESLKVVATPKGRYVAAVKRIRGRATPQVLAAAIGRVVSAMHFPRSMYWTSRQGLRFVRPIRWLLALYAGTVVATEVDGIRAGNLTRGHRLLADKALQVRNFAGYRQQLRRSFVLLEPAARAERIKREQKKILSKRQLRFPAEEARELLDEVAGLEDLLSYAVASTEWPRVIMGEFDAVFLELPAEVLITAMVHHQKYFYLRGSSGKLAAAFLAVIDQGDDRAGLIRQGHERVLGARFRDAEFFWRADRKVPLEARLEELGAATFVEGLGSYREKVERMVKLARWLAENASADGRRADIETLTRAARLAKCDLTTQMVGEFPELQGVMGGLYAREQGEPEAVARAIYEHYRPRRPGDASPSTLPGALLALADKVDTLVGCFAIGLTPSGSSDTFGLRRAGQGIVSIILDHRLRLDLRRLLEVAAASLGEQPVQFHQKAAEVGAQAWEFLLDRVRYLFSAFAYDEVNAVLAAGAIDLVDARARLEALHRLRPAAHFEPLSLAFKRIRNILNQAGDGQRWSAGKVEAGLLQPGAERELFEAFERLRPRVAALREQQQYEQALQLMASLSPQVDRFFDDVLVMTEDAALRENRLTLLAQLLREFSLVADFAEIVPAQPAPAGRQTGGR